MAAPPLAGHAAALAAGALASFGFAPYAWRWALAIGLVALFWLLRDVRPRAAAARGGLFGLGYFGCGVYWIAHTIHVHAHAPLWLAGGLTALLVLYLALYPLAAAGLAARLCPPGTARLLCAAALFALLEWLRGRLLGGFPWTPVGQGALDTWYQGYLPALGAYGAGLLLLLSAAALAAAPRAGRAGASAALALVAGIALGGAGLGTVAWTAPSAAAQPAALVQAGVALPERWRPEFLAEIKQRYRVLTATAGAPLVVWPEAAIPLLYHAHRNYYRELRATALDPGATLLTGAFFAEEPGDGSRRIYTGAINLDTGERYRKSRLVPFGEFTPLRGWLEPVYRRMHVPMRDLSASGDQPAIQIRGQEVGITICYEIIFPEHVRRTAATAGYLVNLSNDSWFGDTRGPWQHLEAARARAAETGRELLRATGTGLTAVLGADGKVRALAPQFQPAVLRAAVRPRAGATPYVRFGDGPFLALALAGFLGTAVRRRGPVRRDRADGG